MHKTAPTTPGFGRHSSPTFISRPKGVKVDEDQGDGVGVVGMRSPKELTASAKWGSDVNQLTLDQASFQ